jgi:hypothetical protein
MIEGGNTENPARREAELSGDFLQERSGQAPMEQLRGVQDLNQRVTGVVMASHHFFE